jgi:hypothetical protein
MGEQVFTMKNEVIGWPSVVIIQSADKKTVNDDASQFQNFDVHFLKYHCSVRDYNS